MIKKNTGGGGTGGPLNGDRASFASAAAKDELLRRAEAAERRADARGDAGLLASEIADGVPATLAALRQRIEASAGVAEPGVGFAIPMRGN